LSKNIKYGEEAQSSVVDGINAVADIVKTTIGPKGRNVLIREKGTTPVITNDGVTIAKSIQLKDNTEDAGASLIISAAQKTNDIAGDGTTTTTLLSSEIINRGFEAIDKYNLNPVQLQKGLISLSNKISDMLLDNAIEVKDDDSIKRVASISSGSDVTGELIANAFKDAGTYGTVIVEDSKTGVTGLSTVMGMKLPNGSVSPYLLERSTLSSEIDDVSVLVMKDKIDNVPDLIPVLDSCNREGRRLLIICDDIEFEPLNFVVMNKARGAINVNIIRLPGLNNDLRNAVTDDICIATGATLVSRESGRPLKAFTSEWFGELESAKIELEETVLKFKDISSTGENLLADRENRVAELETQKETLGVGKDTTHYDKRIANLVGGISVIEVGGNSEIEIKDTKLRIEDALNSVKAAIEEGIVAGGGYSFLEIVKQLGNTNMTADDAIVADILTESLKSVTRQIAENAGMNGDEVVKTCIEKGKGLNAMTGEYTNLIESGVINAVKVDRYCVLNAVSVAGTVLTMGGAIIEENEKDQNLLQLINPGVPVI
jgi:chaperonin GroEL